MGTTKNREDGQVTLWKYGTSINTLGDKGVNFPLYIHIQYCNIQIGLKYLIQIYEQSVGKKKQGNHKKDRGAC